MKILCSWLLFQVCNNLTSFMRKFFFLKFNFENLKERENYISEHYSIFFKLQRNWNFWRFMVTMKILCSPAILSNINFYRKFFLLKIYLLETEDYTENSRIYSTFLKFSIKLKVFTNQSFMITIKNLYSRLSKSINLLLFCNLKKLSSKLDSLYFDFLAF